MRQSLLTVTEFRDILFKDMNQWIATDLFWDDNLYFLFHFNAAMDRLYEHTNWTWNVVVREEHSIAPAAKIFTMAYPVIDILRLKTNDTQIDFECYDSRWVKKKTLAWCWDEMFRIDWNDIILNKEVERIWVTYRRSFVYYDNTMMTTRLDIPVGYELILRDLMLSQVLHLWLWEWVWQYMVNFYNESKLVLWVKAQSDKKKAPFSLKPSI